MIDLKENMFELNYLHIAFHEINFKIIYLFQHAVQFKYQPQVAYALIHAGEKGNICL